MTEQPETQTKQVIDSTPKPDPIETPITETSGKSEVVTIKRTTLNYVVIAVVFFAVGLLVGGVTLGSNTNAQVIEDAVRDVLIDAYIMRPPANMEVLADDDPYLGNFNAPIVIVEFSGYGCPYCGIHFNDTLMPLLENYGQYIKYVYRDFPETNQNVAFPASLAANCAREQNTFWEYHTTLFNNQETLLQTGQLYLVQVAEDLALDTQQFSECLANQDYVSEVQADFQDALAVGVTGTPSFYINGLLHTGARPYTYFENVILRELEKLGIDPDASPDA